MLGFWSGREVNTGIFPVVEHYRAELHAQAYVRVDDQALAELRRRSESGHCSNAIEGIHPTPELAALFAMFLEERVPPDVSGLYVYRYILEPIVPADRDLALSEAV